MPIHSGTHEAMFKENDAFSSFSVDDIPQAKEFYGRTLGLEISEGSMGLEILLANGTRIFVYPKADHAPASFTILNFRVEDVERTVDALTEAGVRFEIYDEPGIETDDRGVFSDGDMKIAWFKDPAGNVLSVVSEP